MLFRSCVRVCACDCVCDRVWEGVKQEQRKVSAKSWRKRLQSDRADRESLGKQPREATDVHVCHTRGHHTHTHTHVQLVQHAHRHTHTHTHPQTTNSDNKFYTLLVPGYPPATVSSQAFHGSSRYVQSHLSMCTLVQCKHVGSLYSYRTNSMHL